MSIHDELEQIAARAPEVVVPADTWERARRARRRERYGVVATVVALVALAGALAWLPFRAPDLDPAGSDEIGVPSHLWAVPERMTRSSDEITDDPTVVGVGAAAWTTWRVPVVVDARHGDYHLLDLPDFVGASDVVDAPVLALSPDGRRLAYGYAVLGREAETAPVPSGVRVVDLTTGAVREVPVPGEEGIVIARIVWSPDGRWLAFTGTQQSWWTPDGHGTSAYLDNAGPVLGRVAPDSTAAETVAIGDDSAAIAVDDRGRVRFARGEVRVWNGDRVEVDQDVDPALFSLSLGRTADGAPVRLTGPRRFEATGVETRLGRVEITLDPEIGGTLSLATALMTREEPTVERPEPAWPRDWGGLATPTGWLLLGLLASTVLLRPVARRSLARQRVAR